MIVAGTAGLGAIPKWEELNYTPHVFVRVANKRLTAYGKWKSAQGNEFNGLASHTFLERLGRKRPEGAKGRVIFTTPTRSEQAPIAGHT
jgi:hypothetical protein